MANPPANLPPQAAALLSGRSKVSTYEATGGKVTAQFAAHNLSLLPPLPSGSIIHDNGCGAGTVSRAILSPRDDGTSITHVPSNIKIHATDIDQVFLDVLEADALAHAWPIEVSNQRSEALSFPDDTFTHSIMNISIIFTPEAGLAGAREMYRTLRPGGIGVANCWESLAWFLPVKRVHEATRPGVPFFAPPVRWDDGVRIRQIMLEAGFREEGMRVERSEGWARTGDLRGWAERTWAFLGGVGGWKEGDGERWEEAVDLLVKLLREADGVREVEGEVWMRASQWFVVAMK